MGMPIFSSSTRVASRATSALVSDWPRAVLTAFTAATVSVELEPRPVPGGTSEARNMDTPLSMPNSCRMALGRFSEPSQKRAWPGVCR